ncbi:uncharacterized protein LOC130613176 [Hydractinia symbiolongicarpus]|uniref:uncharacterized protein LOC130613176 n=1 Tax=Hydractinia symbiolongicarpus TaxID=13093 RepID=UPI00254B9021|nr:uncharacterized protein LOC130613176 [Hydractinia symbiolongicarpus]
MYTILLFLSLVVCSFGRGVHEAKRSISCDETLPWCRANNFDFGCHEGTKGKKCRRKCQNIKSPSIDWCYTQVKPSGEKTTGFIPCESHADCIGSTFHSTIDVCVYPSYC